MTDVEEYIDQQDSPQKEIIQKLRTIIFNKYPNIKERLKMGVIFYGGKFYLVGMSSCVSMGFSKSSLEQGQKLDKVGSVSGSKWFRSVDDVDVGGVEELMDLTTTHDL